VLAAVEAVLSVELGAGAAAALAAIEAMLSAELGAGAAAFGTDGLCGLVIVAGLVGGMLRKSSLAPNFGLTDADDP